MTSLKFQQKYRIPSARATWHDYTGGIYFVTVCTTERECFFGEIINDDMHLNALGKYMEQCMAHATKHFPYAEIPLFVVMPNHVHIVVFIDGDDYDYRHEPDKSTRMSAISPKRGSLSAVIRGIKSAVTKYANAQGVRFGWQTRFHDRIVRDKNELNRIAEYIENNPARWASDKFFTGGE